MLKPYPGFNPNMSAGTPRHAARVKPEAEQYANQGRGSLDLFTDKPRYVDQPMPEPRCPGNASKQNYEHGRNGTVNTLLYGQATSRPDVDAMPRVKPEAEAVAQGHTGQQTKMLFNSYGQLPQSARNAPRVKPEAEGAAEPHQGNRMNCLLHNPSKLPNSARSAPRVKPEAGQNAELGKGGMMNKTLHHYGNVSSREEDHAARVKPEAEGNATQGKGTLSNIMGSYGKLPLSDRPAPKVKGDGQDNAHMDKGGRMSRLMHEGDSLPQDPRPPPRASGKAAKHILKANRGQISKIFAEQGRRQNVPVPGVRGTKTW